MLCVFNLKIMTGQINYELITCHGYFNNEEYVYRIALMHIIWS